MGSVWITKYALTTGVYEREVIEIDRDMAVVVERRGMNGKAFFHGADWHRTQAGAVAQAETMRINKIASLRKQLARLEKLTFSEPESV
jgi:hypothetical protein